ncbi:MAG: hemolysin family protein [Micrococcaceae bacterium]
MEWLLLGLGMLLVLGTGFFVAVEFSLVAVDQPTVQHEVEKNEKGATSLLANLKSLSTQLSGCQLGITITTLLTGYLMEPALGKLLQGPLHSIGITGSVATSVGTIIGMVVATVLSMLFGELIPKNLAIALPMKVGKTLAKPQAIFTRIFKYVVLFLNNTANWVLGLFGLEAKEEVSGARTAGELSSMARRSAQEGTLAEGTANFLARTLDISEYTAEDVMRPRVQMEYMVPEDTASEVIKRSRKTGYSRFPVIGESTDEVKGLVHVKKAVTVPGDKRSEVPVIALMENILEVPETLKLDSLLTQLKDANFQMAVVLDEYGGTAGIATLEDCVEEIVGDVADEHDQSEDSIRELHSGSWVIPGISRSHEIADRIPEFDIDPHDQANYETLGGFIMEQLGRVPKPGDVIETSEGTLTVISMDGKRVDKAHLAIKPRLTEQGAS